jgi:hypothetical protein
MPLVREKAQLMSASEIDRTLVRLAHEILEKTADLGKLAFIGIKRRGVPIAERLAAKIGSLEGHEIPVGVLDISFYRDDLTTSGPLPEVRPSPIPFSVTVLRGKMIVNLFFEAPRAPARASRSPPSASAPTPCPSLPPVRASRRASRWWTR